MDLHFAQLDSLIWLWAVAGAAILFVYAAGARKRAMKRLATSNLRNRFSKAIGPTRRRTRSLLLVSAMLAIVAALLDPRIGLRFHEVAQRNIDVIFALDASQSMLAEDLRPNRLERAKQYIEEVVERAAGDRFGLVVFGGVPSIKVPLTRDTRALHLGLDEVTVQRGRRGGSMLGDAIRVAERALESGDDGLKAIVLLSDGEDMDSYPVEAAAAASKNGISIWTVGLGNATEGARIPIEVNGERLFLTHEGQEVWSTMQPTILQEIADAADGRFIPAGTANLDLATIYEDVIAPASGRRIEASRTEDGIPRYRWLVGLALLLLAIESSLGLRTPSPRQAITWTDTEPSAIQEKSTSRRAAA